LRFLSHEIVKLADNRLTEEGIAAVIKELKQQVKYLDFSYNWLGPACARELGEYVKCKAMQLRGLNLENTHLGDTGTIELCNALIDHPRLMELNLARNNITDLSCKTIAQLIKDTYYLVSINLHWNTLKGEGATLILQSVMLNNSIKILDLSWNTIGVTKNKVFANKLAELLSTQDNLVHLDISNNRLSSFDCAIISKGLEENHSLWGMHIIGNEGKLDTKGFMQPGKGEKSMANGHLSQRINGRKMVLIPLSEVNAHEREVDNCWICEGWNEVLFEWPKEKNSKIVTVYLHLEFEKYKPDLMSMEKGKTDRFYLYRMCPPGKCRFFFTVEGKCCISPKYTIIPANLQAKVFFI